MTREELLQAVGHVDEAILASCDEQKAGKRYRIGWKAVAVAAVLVGLATSAAAVIIGEFRGSAEAHKEQNEMMVNGEYVPMPEQEWVEIRLEFPAAEEAQKTIQMLYVPGTAENTQLRSVDFTGNVDAPEAVSVEWRPESFARYETITYTQEAAFCYSDGEKVRVAEALPAEGFYTETVQREDRTYFRVTSALYKETAALAGEEQYLYWTDGMYVFSLCYPWWMQETQIWELADSLTPVEDIRQYIDSASAAVENNLKKDWEHFVGEYASSEEYTFHAAAGQGYTQVTETNGVAVHAEFPMQADAPQYLERVIAPCINGVQMYGPAASEVPGQGVIHYSVRWNLPGFGDNGWVCYDQGTVCCYREGQPLDVITEAKETQIVEAEVFTFGNNSFYQVRFAERLGEEPGRRILYWTDGDYIFRLDCPCEMTDDQVQEIIASITGA